MLVETVFLVTSFCFTLFCVSFEDAVAQVAESSDNRLNEYRSEAEVEASPVK